MFLISQQKSSLIRRKYSFLAIKFLHTSSCLFFWYRSILPPNQHFSLPPSPSYCSWCPSKCWSLESLWLLSPAAKSPEIKLVLHSLNYLSITQWLLDSGPPFRCEDNLSFKVNLCHLIIMHKNISPLLIDHNLRVGLKKNTSLLSISHCWSQCYLKGKLYWISRCADNRVSSNWWFRINMFRLSYKVT